MSMKQKVLGLLLRLRIIEIAQPSSLKEEIYNNAGAGAFSHENHWYATMIWRDKMDPILVRLNALARREVRNSYIDTVKKDSSELIGELLEYSLDARDSRMGMIR